MPAVHPPATVLVTGISGFISSWVCRTLLHTGYSVRGTTRSATKGEYMKTLFAEFGDRFEIVIVEDVTKPGAYDEAVKGNVSAVIHIAGAATFSAETLGDFKAILVDGTVNLLQSILKHSKTMKRFVYLSSAQALLGKPLTHIYTEDDWNDGAVAAVETNLAECDGQTRYQAGKVLAERAVLEFPDKHGGVKKIGWDTASLVPAWLFGPVIHPVNSLEELNFSSKIFYDHMTKPRDKAEVNNYGSDFLDVRDLADAMVATLKTEEAGGERFILDAGAYTWQNLYDVLNEEPAVPGVCTGDPSAPKFSFPCAFCNSAKAERILGVSFRSLKETARDAIASLRERGLVP